MEIENKYGTLLNGTNIKLHRQYFKEMTKLLGINVLHRSIKPGQKWTNYGEVDASHNPPVLVGCIFNEHPDQKTLKKMGWVSELQENASIISVPYDLPGLQVGSLFIVPSGIDNSEGRLFRCVKLSNIMIYPASVSCEIVPEYENTYVNSLHSHKHSSFNLLNSEEVDD